MKLIGSETSPFTRLTRVICEELEIPYEFEVTPPFGKLDDSHDEYIGSYNPLRKVPILVYENGEIFDSRVIIRYLLNQKKTASGFRTSFPKDYAEDNVLTVGYGIMDAGILKFMLKIKHPEIKTESGYMARAQNRVEEGLLWLERQPVLGDSFGVTEAALICGLEWIQKRNIARWNSLPNLANVYRNYFNRESLIKTRIPVPA